MPCSLVGLGGCERVAIVDVDELPPGMLTKRRGHLVTFNRRCERVGGVDVNTMTYSAVSYNASMEKFYLIRVHENDKWC